MRLTSTRKWDTKKQLQASINLAANLIDYDSTTEFENDLKVNVECLKTNWDKVQISVNVLDPLMSSK